MYSWTRGIPDLSFEKKLATNHTKSSPRYVQIALCHNVSQLNNIHHGNERDKNQRIKSAICLYGNRSRYKIVATAAIKSRTVSQNETFASDVEKGTT